MAKKQTKKPASKPKAEKVSTKEKEVIEIDEQVADEFEDETKLPVEVIEEELPKMAKKTPTAKVASEVEELQSGTDALILLLKKTIAVKNIQNKSSDRFHNAIQQLERLKRNVFVD